MWRWIAKPGFQILGTAFIVCREKEGKMMTRDTLRNMRFHSFTFLIALCIFNLFGEAKVEVKDGLIILDLRNADLSGTLKAIEKAPG